MIVMDFVCSCGNKRTETADANLIAVCVCGKRMVRA
jgi:hypothetical protein